jgi:hypothetical protein
MSTSALPSGTVRLVKSKWDDIDRTVTPALERFTSRRIESALGYTHPTKDMYGCGVWGCAYPTSVPGWTVKITADPNEGPTVWNVMKSPRLRGHQAIAYIIGIWQIIGGPEGGSTSSCVRISRHSMGHMETGSTHSMQLCPSMRQRRSQPD